MRIRAILHAMAESEIMDMIPADRLRTIKTRDPHPTFKAYVIGHEGEARGNLVGVGNIVKRWFADTVKKLNDMVKSGLQLFHGHGATNDTTGRTPIGEVVGKKLMNIQDRLSSVITCWIYPDYGHLPLDVASIEADVDLKGESGDSLYVADVNEITGIALGNSKVETPGFPGATLLGQLQAFAEKKQFKITLFEGGNMTLEEARKAIKEAKLKPSDIFGLDAIMADSLVTEQVKEKISNARGYDVRKTEDLVTDKAKLQQQLTEAQDKIKEHEKTIGDMRIETSKTKVDSLFDTQKEERKLTDQQAKYLKNRLGKFTPEDPEKLESEFDSWLDTGLEDYKKDAEAMGIKLESEDGNGEGTKPNAGAEPDTKPTGAPDNKYLDPEKNPMIKADAD
jgi:hypothetical protein